MPPRQAKSRLVDMVALGEAAGEGEQGIDAVLDTILNRARAQGKTMEQIVSMPKQFSASARPDLEQFYLQQPTPLLWYTMNAVNARQNKDFQPAHPYQYYVTKALWEKRNTLPEGHWLHRMKAMQTIGNHVFVEEIPR